MKKFLSIFLAVAFVFSAMCMSVLAAKTYEDIDPVTEAGDYAVVGSQGENNTIEDGVTSWQDSNLKNNTADITVNFNDNTSGEGPSTTTIHNRYAIDITYGSLIVDLTNITNTDIDDENATTIEFVWDVNKHMYVPYNSETGAATNPVANETYEIVINEAFSLTNHSDLEIYYKPEVAVAANYNTILQLKIRSTGATKLGTDDLTDLAAPGTFMVQRATAGTYKETGITEDDYGSATEGIKHAIVALPYDKATATQADWIEVINELSEALNEEAIASGAVIGKLTITITSETTETTKLYDATDATP